MLTQQLSAGILIEPAAAAVLRAEAARTGAHEACGALLGRTDFAAAWHIVRALALHNGATDPAREYMIDAVQVRAAERAAAAARLDLIGFFHSHPRGGCTPSQTDLARAWPLYLYAIVDGATADIAFWQLAEDRASFRRVGGAR